MGNVRSRALAEHESIGPVGSAVIFGIESTATVLLKVRWSSELDQVNELAGRTEEGIDVYSLWGLYIQPDGTSLSLEIGWPDLGYRAVLYFPLPKWKHELTLIQQSGGSFIVTPDVKIPEAEEQGRIMGVSAAGEILDLVPTLL